MFFKAVDLYRTLNLKFNPTDSPKRLCPPLNWKLGCLIHWHWVNCRSKGVHLGKGVHRNYSGKKRISGVGLSLVAVTKIIKRYFLAHLMLFLMLSEIFSISANSW